MMIETIAKMGVRALPPALGYALVRRLAGRAVRAPVSVAEAAALRCGHATPLGPDGRTPAWTWGEGPLVVLVHGWGGRAAQMAPMAVALASQGFRALAFDVTGHGDSAEREVRWEFFMRDIAAVIAQGPVAGLVGHSAGGLAMMAARKQYRLRVDRFVCISAPHHPYPPLREIRRRLDPGERVCERYRRYLEEQFQSDWASLENGVAWSGAGEELLLCYDAKDRYVDPGDGERIAATCAGSRLIRTDGYGHARILSAPEIVDAITGFVGGGAVGRKEGARGAACLRERRGRSRGAAAPAA
jgi:pimeloyl-ACP methyl ester carboxylesterase